MDNEDIKDLTVDIMHVVKEYGFDHMPTSTEMRKVNKTLASRIDRNGGYVYWREKLKLSEKVREITKERKKRPSKWNENNIESKLLSVVEELNMGGYMPTAKQITESSAGNSLATAISKNGGFNYWAEKLNLKSQSSTYKLGNDYELIAEESLKKLGFTTSLTSMGHPYDILVNNSVKVDVKSCLPSFQKGSRIHVAGLNKKQQTCDIYIIYCLSEDGITIEKELVIPSHHLTGTTLNMGRNTKYDAYSERYDYIEKYSKFMSDLEKLI